MNRTIQWRSAVLAGALVCASACTPNETDRNDANEAAQAPPLPSVSDPTQTQRPAPAVPEASPFDNTPEVVASADIQPVGGSSVRGKIEFRESETGPVSLDVTLMGLERGSHGIEIYNAADCTALSREQESGAAESEPVVSSADQELGSVTADASGMAHTTLGNVSSARRNLVGNLVVVYGAASNPGAAAGDEKAPVACGVIDAADDTSLSQTESAAKRGV